MAKISYTNLKLKTDTSVSTFKVGDTEIEVLNYLPIEDKIALVELALQNAEEPDGVFNPIKLDLYFHLYMFYMYTNVNFTEKQKTDEFKLYNTLQSSGVMDSFLQTIVDSEYQELITYLETYKQDKLTYRNSLPGVIRYAVTEVPSALEGLNDILKNIDISKYQEVINLALTSNGGRPIE